MASPITVDRSFAGAAIAPAFAPFLLLALQTLALWPVWRWYAARLRDGSDEPSGLAALLAALVLLYARRRDLNPAPRPGLLLAGAGLTLLQAAGQETLPPLVRALLGVAALGSTLAAHTRPGTRLAPILALLVLSLPLVASLQFYLGHPLRVLAAWGAGGLLRAGGLAVEVAGTSLSYQSRLVLVDGPCSGVHMLWVGLFLATVLTALTPASGKRLLGNELLAVGLVLAGNIVRNALLFLKESGFWALPDWTHAGIGVLAFLLVLLPLASIVLRRTP
jgi:exosortase/archaeosortase family protein